MDFHDLEYTWDHMAPILQNYHGKFVILWLRESILFRKNIENCSMSPHLTGSIYSGLHARMNPSEATISESMFNDASFIQFTTMQPMNRPINALGSFNIRQSKAIGLFVLHSRYTNIGKVEIFGTFRGCSYYSNLEIVAEWALLHFRTPPLLLLMTYHEKTWLKALP